MQTSSAELPCSVVPFVLSAIPFILLSSTLSLCVCSVASYSHGIFAPFRHNLKHVISEYGVEDEAALADAR
jgi:hypothetical protein